MSFKTCLWAPWTPHKANLSPKIAQAHPKNNKNIVTNYEFRFQGTQGFPRSPQDLPKSGTVHPETPPTTVFNYFWLDLTSILVRCMCRFSCLFVNFLAELLSMLSRLLFDFGVGLQCSVTSVQAWWREGRRQLDNITKSATCNYHAAQIYFNPLEHLFNVFSAGLGAFGSFGKDFLN